MYIQNPRQSMLQVSGITLQQVEMFKYLVVVFTIDRKRNKQVDTRIAEANAVLRELYRSVLTKPELSLQHSQFLKRSLFRSSPVIMNLGRPND